MQIRHLNYLVTLSQERHFGRAAGKISISQSALSQAIQQIERYFGTHIVLRQQGKFIGFTQEGDAILNWARTTLVDHDRLVHFSASAPRGELQGRLRIGIAPVSMSIASLLTSKFNAEHPGVSIRILSMNLPDVIEKVGNFEIDVGVNYIDGLQKKGLRTYPLYAESYYLLVPDGHYLSERPSISWEEAADFPLCMLTPDLYNRILLDKMFASVNRTPKAVLETNCSLGLFAHVRSGKWLTIIPHSYFYILGDWSYIRSVRLESSPSLNTIGLIAPDITNMPPIVSAFIEIVESTDIASHLRRFIS